MDPAAITLANLFSVIKEAGFFGLCVFLVWWNLRATDKRETEMRTRLASQDAQFTEREKALVSSNTAREQTLIANNLEREQVILSSYNEREARYQSLLECYGTQMHEMALKLELMSSTLKELSELVHDWTVSKR